MLQLIMDVLDMGPEASADEVYQRVSIVKAALKPVLDGPVDTTALEAHYCGFLRSCRPRLICEPPAG